MHLCKFFLRWYVLNVATILSSNLLKLTTHICKNKVTRVFFNPSAQLNKHSSQLRFIGWSSWEQLLLQKPPQKEVTGIQIRAETWPKTVFKKSNTTFAICGVAPSCTNHCVCRGKPFTISCRKKLFWSMCKYGSEFTVSLNKTGPIKPWQPQQLFSLHDCFFCGSPQEVPSLRTACSVCSRSHPNENRPCQKTMGCKEFNLFLLPRLHTEVNVVRKCMHHKFCVQLFSNLFEVFFALSVETFHSHELPALLVCQGCAGSPLRVLPQPQERAQLVGADAPLPSRSLPLRTF